LSAKNGGCAKDPERSGLDESPARFRHEASKGKLDGTDA
jgi:hypothetical protein